MKTSGGGVEVEEEILNLGTLISIMTSHSFHAVKIFLKSEGKRSPLLLMKKF